MHATLFKPRNHNTLVRTLILAGENKGKVPQTATTFPQNDR
ncbi:MAG: hypothetical protein FD143_3218 [Ignavibacteria bacterium]|nr:MAG: hypothetical protein FD143_3218 [Ignavibacteria bacterium]